jgi:hypothetical protein
VFCIHSDYHLNIMETYFGYIETVQDALLVIEAARRGLLPRAQHRLTDSERANIRSGSIFVWDESEVGMRRWTDGRSWSPSRVNGCFLNYRELEHRRCSQGASFSYSMCMPHDNMSTFNWMGESGQRKPMASRMRTSSTGTSSGRNKNNFRYKVNGLTKRTISVTISEPRKLHLISYFCKQDVINGHLRRPRDDPVLSKQEIPSELYPDVIVAPNTSDQESDRLRLSSSPQHEASPCYAAAAAAYPSPRSDVPMTIQKPQDYAVPESNYYRMNTPSKSPEFFAQSPRRLATPPHSLPYNQPSLDYPGPTEPMPIKPEPSQRQSLPTIDQLYSSCLLPATPPYDVGANWPRSPQMDTFRMYTEDYRQLNALRSTLTL